MNLAKKNYALYVGSKLERIIRTKTAKVLGFGVYYPEPNFCVLLRPGSDSLPYSFIDKKREGSKFESPSLLSKILLDSLASSNFVFDEGNPIVTSSNRAVNSKTTGKPLKFSFDFNNGGVPDKADFNTLSQIIQSTSNPKKWAEGLYYNRGFEIHGSTGTFASKMTNL